MANCNTAQPSKPAIDSDTFYENYALWGDFGWTIPDEMAVADIAYASSVPVTQTADCLMMTHYINDSFLQTLFLKLRSNISQSDDLDEAIWLFQLGETRHYKPCAMLIASLIDGALIVNDKPDSSRSRRKGKHSLETMESDAAATVALKHAIENAGHAYNYYYKDAKDFTPSAEGEMNRNFLLHGMMHKPVERTTCIKLFLLLNAATTLPLMRYYEQC